MADQLSFPETFFIGAATAAHQIEGNNTTSDWWAFENREGTPIQERSGDALDSLHRWREDMDLLAEFGLNAYRFSIEWARIEPAPGKFSRAMINHYREMVTYAQQIGLTPIITLHHFTNPLWFRLDGAWTSASATQRFASYIRAIAPILDAGVKHVVTFNEPNIAAVMQTVLLGQGDLETGLGGGLPRGHEPTALGLARAHHEARDLLHRNHPGIQVGWSIANQCVQHVDGGQDLAEEYRHHHEDWYLQQAKEDDFVGVQSYTRTIFGPEGIIAPDPAVPLTQMGWEFYPQAVGEAVRNASRVSGGVPIVVTENGVATADDDERIRYTASALASIHTAMAEGSDVRGYLHWSALDNYEWGRWEPTFGLIAVDRETFTRHPKPSGAWLGSIARTKRLPQ